jgi:hypothetical protein
VTAVHHNYAQSATVSSYIAAVCELWHRCAQLCHRTTIAHSYAAAEEKTIPWEVHHGDVMPNRNPFGRYSWHIVLVNNGLIRSVPFRRTRSLSYFLYQTFRRQQERKEKERRRKKTFIRVCVRDRLSMCLNVSLYVHDVAPWINRKPIHRCRPRREIYLLRPRKYSKIDFTFSQTVLNLFLTESTRGHRRTCDDLTTIEDERGWG